MLGFRLVVLSIVLLTLVLLGFKIWSNKYVSKLVKYVYLVFFLIAGGAMVYMLVISLFLGSNW